MIDDSRLFNAQSHDYFHDPVNNAHRTTARRPVREYRRQHHKKTQQTVIETDSTTFIHHNVRNLRANTAEAGMLTRPENTQPPEALFLFETHLNSLHESRLRKLWSTSSNYTLYMSSHQT